MVKPSRRWIAWMTRFGYGTRGVVFTVVGLLALEVAIGAGTRAEGTKGAIYTIGAQPFGQILLGLVGVGLSCYVVWRFMQAFFDPAHSGGGLTAGVRRAAYLISGIFYSALALFALQLAFGFGVSTNNKERWARWALEQPHGAWLVGLVGAVLIGIGIQTLYRAVAATFLKLYDLDGLSDAQHTVAVVLGRTGLTTLGLALMLIGGFVITGALQSDPSEAIGLGGALRTLGARPHGPWLLGAAGVGVIVYGGHCFMLAAYRRIQPAESDA